MASENEIFAQQLIPKIELVPSREWLNLYFDLVKRVLDITGLKDNDPRLSMPLLPDKNSSLHVSINARYVIALRKKKVNGQFALFIGSIFAPYYRDIQELSQNEQVHIDWRFRNLIGEKTETPIFLRFESMNEFLRLLNTSESVRQCWQEALIKEVNRRKSSSYRDNHDSRMYKLVVDDVFRKEILNFVYSKNMSPKSQIEINTNRCWWFGVNNISKRSTAAKNHVIYSELIPLLDGSQREFEWRYHNKAKRFYEQMQPDDKIVFWMGDGDNPNWGVFGFGKISRILYNSNPALRRYFLSMDFIPSSSIAPYPSKHPQETETTKFLLNLFGLNFRPLGKTFRNLGYDTTRTIITIDEVGNEKYNSLLEYAEAYFSSSEPLEFAEKVEKDIASGKIIDSIDVERELQKLNPDILRIKAQSAKRKPERQATQSLAFVRSPFVSAYAKQRANGICQLCDNPAPFVSRKGEPYLETHHIIWLSNGGDDTIENTVALCPNCHRKMHKLDLADDKKYLEQKAKSLAQ